MRIDFPNIEGTGEIYMDVMRAICGQTEGKSMVDLCCCTAPNTPLLGYKDRRYIDMLDRKLDHPDEQQFFIQGNVLNFIEMEEEWKFDAAICSDGIEHLTIPDGYKLLKIMERISKKQILFTPTTDLFGMYNEGDTSPEEHRSLWRPEDLPRYAAIVFPDYHRVWNGGAWWFWRCEDTLGDFARVITELKNKPWAKL